MRLPKGDKHFFASFVVGQYQQNVLRAAIPHIKEQTLAVDVGAHVGFWARSLAIIFERVVAIEPNAENFMCLCQNVPVNVLTLNWAVGKEYGYCSSVRKTLRNSGDCVLESGVDVRITPLDSFGWGAVGLLKVDVQGMELDVLKGAEQLLKRERPVVIVETTLDDIENDDCGAYLATLGATAVKTVGKDTIFAWSGTG